MKAIVNGIATSYDLRGAGSPVTLVHALGLDLHQWRWQVGDFAVGHQVLRYDVRGHGASDKPMGPYSLELFAEDLHDLLVSLGISRTALVGLSMGGMIAQAFALAHPENVSALVLADTAAEYPPEARRQFEERARVAETQGMAPLVPATLERWFTAPFRQAEPGVVEEIRQTLERAEPAGYAASCRAVAGLALAGRLGQIRCPTLVVVGDEDPSTPPSVARQIHEAITGSRLEIIPNAAHLSSVAQPEIFNRAVLGFLAT